MATVTLTRTQRDGLHWNVAMMIDDNGLPNPTSETEADVKAIVARLPICCAVLDQIGWNEHGDRDSYVLDVDAEVAAVVACMVPSARGYIDDHVYFLEVTPGDASLERDLADARGTLAGLLSIVDAGGALAPVGAV